jgi:hypothetical protein
MRKQPAASCIVIAIPKGSLKYQKIEQKSLQWRRLVYTDESLASKKRDPGYDRCHLSLKLREIFRIDCLPIAGNFTTPDTRKNKDEKTT